MGVFDLHLMVLVWLAVLLGPCGRGFDRTSMGLVEMPSHPHLENVHQPRGRRRGVSWIDGKAAVAESLGRGVGAASHASAKHNCERDDT